MSTEGGCKTHSGSDDVTNEALGGPMSAKSQLLGTAAGMTQSFEPVNNICAFLNAFHIYADQPSRAVESYHYCSHVNEDVRQCLIYDSNEKNARLIGGKKFLHKVVAGSWTHPHNPIVSLSVEYMITPRLYDTLEQSERRLWHSHVFEVKSGMLIMPKPTLVPDAAWEVAETTEMEEIIQLYGKVFHFWQVDRGDKLPLGQPRLMKSVTSEDQVPGLWERVAERDRKLVADYKRKKELRLHIQEPRIHPDADRCQVELQTPTTNHHT